MKDALFFAFDSETGGLKPDQADMLTFYGAVVDSNFKVLDEVNLKLKPNEGRLPRADAGALKVNGIDISTHLADPATVTYAEGGALLEAMLKKHSKKVGRRLNITPFGYNVSFDEKFTWHHLLNETQWFKYMHYKKVDVMDRVDFLREAGWLPQEVARLGDVNDFLNLPKRAAHDAKNDTLMTIDVYQALLKLMESKKSGGSTQDLIALLEAE
jgi:DNA polymerase III epsilon subunit-like protein